MKEFYFMNKRIVDATHEEIAQAMKDNAIRKIAVKRRENLQKTIFEDTGEVEIYTKYQQEQAESDNLGLEFRLYKGNERRKQRIKERITRMLETEKAIFLTLTFSDSMFSRNCSAETRRRYVRRFLREQCADYLANIDFGSTNQREHYHAVVVPKTKIDFARYRKQFNESMINAQHIRVDSNSIKFVGQYINKLTNHALKENGHYKRLIFCRNQGASI